MKAVEALGKQPEGGNKILRTMIIGQAITETTAIFALVMSLVLLFTDTTGAHTVKAFALLGGDSLLVLVLLVLVLELVCLAVRRWKV